MAWLKIVFCSLLLLTLVSLLNLFSLVRFPNLACNINSSLTGTCFSVEDCQSRGGQGAVTCASGFGVCCLFSSSCGSTLTSNCSYFVSSPSISEGSCQAMICTDDSVCQLRLDLEQFQISGPFSQFNAGSVRPQLSAVGQCLFDKFTVTSPGNKAPPVICGSNNGYHMYVDSCTPCNNLEVSLSSEVATSRSWRIKVTQIDCASRAKAPDGCLQYFTSTSGTLNTFNNGGSSTHLANQDYTICIRSQRGFCSICYWSTAFRISNAFDSVGGKAEFDERCGPAMIVVPTNAVNPLQNEGLQDYITIPGGRCAPGIKGGVIDRYCGEILACSIDVDNSGAQVSTPSTVCTDYKPFQIRVFTDEFEEQTNEDGTSATDPPQFGFQIMYAQQRC